MSPLWVSGPMVIAAAAAVIVATLLKGQPIYDTLRLRMQPSPGGMGK